MNREMFRVQLTEADETIATRQAQIEKQRSEIAELRRNGLDVTRAQAALENLELSLALYQRHCDRLAEEFEVTRDPTRSSSAISCGRTTSALTAKTRA